MERRDDSTDMKKVAAALFRILCRIRHKRHWHEQVYTDRVRYYQRTECWKCGAVQSAYRVCRNQKHPHETRASEVRAEAGLSAKAEGLPDN